MSIIAQPIPGEIRQVKIIKPSPDTKLGILLVIRETGFPPEVESLKVGGLGHSSQRLFPGDVILTVNGKPAVDDEVASNLIRLSEREVVLEVKGGVGSGKPVAAQGSGEPVAAQEIQQGLPAEKQMAGQGSKIARGIHAFLPGGSIFCGLCGLAGRPNARPIK
jgi:hypothetical protein